MSSSNNNNDDNNDNDNDKHHKKDYSTLYIVIVIVWIVLGVLAYVSAFQCTHEKYTGGDARKISMLLLAGLLGPFYWFIQPSVRASGYCNLK